jgi:hypothetical protein
LLPIAQIYGFATTGGEIRLRNQSYEIQATPGTQNTRQGVPVNAFGGNAQNQTTALNFIANVSGSYGVNPAQVFHPGQVIPGVNVPASRVGTQLQSADLSNDSQRNLLLHQDHLHFGMTGNFRTPMPATQPWLNVNPQRLNWI